MKPFQGLSISHPNGCKGSSSNPSFIVVITVGMRLDGINLVRLCARRFGFSCGWPFLICIWGLPLFGLKKVILDLDAYIIDSFESVKTKVSQVLFIALCKVVYKLLH